MRFSYLFQLRALLPFPQFSLKDFKEGELIERGVMRRLPEGEYYGCDPLFLVFPPFRLFKTSGVHTLPLPPLLSLPRPAPLTFFPHTRLLLQASTATSAKRSSRGPTSAPTRPGLWDPVALPSTTQRARRRR